MNRKPVIAIDISSTKRGGPYVSSLNLINSELKNNFTFVPIIYKTYLGRFISIKRIADIVKQLKEAKPDGILITGLQLSGFHVCVAACLAGVKTRIVIIRGSSTEAIVLSKIKRYLIYKLEYLTLMYSTAFYGVSKYASQLSATKYFPYKNKGYVYNIPTIKGSNSPIKKNDLNFKESDIVISSSGRITKEKGFDVLSDTIKRIKNPSIKFLIIGDGEYLAEMKEKLSEPALKDRIYYTGYTNRVMDYLCASDIFVLPTLHETLSVSLLEASSLGLPLISCNVGGIPEIIENGKNGYLISPSDSKALADAIEKLANDAQLRSFMGNEAKEKIERKFCSDKLIGQVRDIIINELEHNETN